MVETKQIDLEKDSTDSPAILNDPEVRLELQRILASDLFKGSMRCREFLKHIVNVACSNSSESLKERSIGIAVFGRAPDYDTGADAIVRVKASEVRRRLAQYNQSADPERSIIIELTSGSYTPKIIRRTPAPKPAIVMPLASDTSKRHGSLMIFAISAIVLTAIVLVGVMYTSSMTPLKRFWRPFLGSDQPIICATAPGTYYLSSDELAHRSGDSPAIFPLNKNLQALGGSGRVMIANDATSTDLTMSPAVLLGGPKYNRWTQMLTQNLRFSFRMVHNIPAIVDQNNPTRSWDDQTPSSGKTVVDYVIITRLVATPAHKTILCIAGLGATGTRLGAEFLFKPGFVKQVLTFAPANWDKKNLQLVVRFLPGEQSYTSELVAATYW